jgi:NTP pyrophosphatase (non-canonical NTP hydrolase)
MARYYTELDVLKLAISKFGATEQETVAIEECSELIQAITHKHRGRKHNLVEEIADVEIMLEQLKIINGCADEVEDIKSEKLARLLLRMGGVVV